MGIIGVAGAIISGLLLGLTGTGGSILTVPILVYLFGINPVLATAYSLFIVGFGALAGAYSKYKKGLVNTKIAIVFAIPSLIATYLMRYYVVPALPMVWFSVENFVFTKNKFTMILLATVMCVVALHMIKRGGQQQIAAHASRLFNYLNITRDGLVVGILSGAVGVGGGFLIVPALILRVGLATKIAVGTSLLIMTLNSFFGFMGDFQYGREINWSLLVPFTFFMVVGVFTGTFLSRYLSGQQLKKGTGWLIIILSVGIIIKEFILDLRFIQ